MSNSHALDRFVPDLSLSTEVFDLVGAEVLVEQMAARIVLEDVPGAADWYTRHQPEEWEMLKGLFHEVDAAWMERDMARLRAAIELFWMAFRNMLAEFTAARANISEQSRLT